MMFVKQVEHTSNAILTKTPIQDKAPTKPKKKLFTKKVKKQSSKVKEVTRHFTQIVILTFLSNMFPSICRLTHLFMRLQMRMQLMNLLNLQWLLQKRLVINHKNKHPKLKLKNPRYPLEFIFML